MTRIESGSVPVAPGSSILAAAPTPAPASTISAVTTPSTTTPSVSSPPASSTPSGPVSAESASSFTGSALFPWAGDVDREGAPADVLTVEHFDGALGFLRGRELDEGEAAGAARELVEHELDAQDGSSSSEVVLQVTLHRLVGQIAYKETILVVHNMKAAPNSAWDPATGRTQIEGRKL